MKIISYNVNGIRAAIKKGWLGWLKAANPDIICLQEIKAQEGDIKEEQKAIEDLGYNCYLYPAQKKGYSGVAILSKKAPDNVVYGCRTENYDNEGRILRTDFDSFSVMSLYMPSGSSGDERQQVKFEFMHFFEKYIDEIKKECPNLIISGDYNICHRPIDIHNPKSNANSSGFLPEERDWMEKFINNGFIDTFRHFNGEPDNYTWWSYRFKARDKNLGWRIDYHMATEGMEKRLKRAYILADAYHSDHCPIGLEID